MKKVEEIKKKGLQKEEKFDIITYVAEKDGIKTENLKKVFKKTLKKGLTKTKGCCIIALALLRLRLRETEVRTS